VDQQTGNFYQDNQLYNPDIDYSDPFVASNNQIVGVLDPTDRSLQVVEDAYGIDPSFYTDSPIYSASDFRVGSSATGTDYTDYVVNDNDNALSHSEIMAMHNNNAATNQFGSTVSVGYGTGQVDPGLAAAAGYTNSPAPGAFGNNASGSNSIVQQAANLATPSDGTSYVDGKLTYDSNNDSGGSDANGGNDDKIVCTEMYRQTQLDDWLYAMKTWYVYQRKHLTPYHQIGYHAIFRPFVKGMNRSSTLTKLGAYAAERRTVHLRHVLTKGKSPDSLFGRVLCKVLEPPLYVVGRVVSAFRKDA
jgi:hypothetical protein